MSDLIKVLIVDDSDSDAKLAERALRQSGLAVQFRRVDSEPDMRAALASSEWDVVLSDWGMPHFDALSALGVSKELSPGTPFIVVSGTIGEEAAVQAMRAGARDYVPKNRLSPRLGAVVSRELREAQTKAQAEQALRQVEDQLRQSQKMEAVGTLAGGIAHDFNNLLTVILGQVDILTLDRGLSASVVQSIGEIQQAAERASDLTRRLLAFSRRQIMLPRVVSVSAVVQGLHPMLSRLVGEDVQFEVHPAPGPDHVRADPSQLEQVIMNLVINARDAMPRGGRLDVAVQAETLDGEEADSPTGLVPGTHVTLSVTDTGAGMDAATQSRMFEPFFTTKPATKGTGLGLSVVFGIVHQSGGRLRVRSQLGQGTTIQVLFPQVGEPPDAKDSPPPPAPTSRVGRETILLVEDHQQVRVMLRGILRSAGYTVFDAGDAEEALSVLGQHVAPIDLLCTDVIMPGMNGCQLADRVRALQPQVKTLFISGYPGTTIVEHGVPEGEGHFLAKPITPRKLLQTLAQLFDGPLAEEMPLNE